MAKRIRESDISDPERGSSSRVISPTVRFSRGRPSRKKIEQMIAATKASELRVSQQSASQQTVAEAMVETLFGTASLLNPDIRISFVSSFEYAAMPLSSEVKAQGSGSFFSLLSGFIDHIGRQSVTYYGVVNPAAFNTLAIQPETLKSFVRKKQGYDIYFCNLDIESECFHVNQWQRVVAEKPEFEAYASLFLNAAGLDANLLNKVIPSRVLASFSLLIGSERFWQEFKAFLQSVENRILQSVKRDELLSRWGYFGRELSECLLVEFMRCSTHLKSFKLKSTQLEKRLNGFLREMRTMKDLACTSQSARLLSCWNSYKSLYQATPASAREQAFPDPQAVDRYSFF